MSATEHPVDSSHVELAEVELDWTPVFEADVVGTLADRFFVEQGSIYAPGWHVRERVRDNYLVSMGCFGEKADADEYLAYLLEQEGGAR